MKFIVLFTWIVANVSIEPASVHHKHNGDDDDGSGGKKNSQNVGFFEGNPLHNTYHSNYFAASFEEDGLLAIAFRSLFTPINQFQLDSINIYHIVWKFRIEKLDAFLASSANAHQLILSDTTINRTSEYTHTHARSQAMKTNAKETKGNLTAYIFVHMHRAATLWHGVLITSTKKKRTSWTQKTENWYTKSA